MPQCKYMVQRIKKQKQKKNHAFLFIFLALIIAAVVVYGILIFKPRNTKSAEDKQDDASDTEQNTEQKDDKKSEEEQKSDEIKPESEKNNPQYEGKDPNTYEDLTGIVNYLGFSEGNLKVIARFDQFVSGTCDFTLISPSGKTTSASDALIAEQSTSACELNISSNEHGNWKVTITATAGNKRGTISREDNV